MQERETQCKKWLADFGVTPGADWGTLPETERKKWGEYGCDEMSGVVGAITTFGGTRPPPPKDSAAEKTVPVAEKTVPVTEKKPRQERSESEDLAGDDGGAVEHRDGWDSGDAREGEGGAAVARARGLADDADVKPGDSVVDASAGVEEKNRRYW